MQTVRIAIGEVFISIKIIAMGLHTLKKIIVHLSIACIFDISCLIM